MSTERSAVAIIGMACRFPGAPDLATFRSNLERGVDAITEAPPGRLDPAYYDPDSTAIDRVTCRRGGFLGAELSFDPAPFGIMPIAAEGSEPDQMLTLELVVAALKDAGLEAEADLPRQSTAVIFGRGGYFGIRLARMVQQAIFAPQLSRSAAALLPGLTPEQLAEIDQDFRSQLGHYGADTAIGLVPNLAASLIANRFDFAGSAYTIDAACASSLIAIDQAVRELETGRADLVITGGMHLCDDVMFWNVFSRLGAISRSQQIRPFDRRADGLLIGEGIGVLVLARQADAERWGSRIYALIRGIGIASDGRGKTVMQPRSSGQILALERAWRAARLDPATIGLLEAHGTGTPEGDQTELSTIARFFGGELGGQPGLGTVKSMIGHTMPAAGAAGLIKAALAAHHGFLPPTLHCEEPSELVAKTRFRLITATEPWPHDLPRRAAVNVFGFGGINAHLVLDAVVQDAAAFHHPRRYQPSEMLLLAASSPEALLSALEGESTSLEAGPFRLALERPSAERRALAAKLVSRGTRWNGRNGIWYVPSGLAAEGGRVAFLYPGVDGLFEPRINDLAAYLGLGLPRNHDAREDLVAVAIGIIALGRWLTDILENLGIHPQAMAGHSIGEWTGMMASGILETEDVDRFFEQMAPTLSFRVPGLVFAAAGCGIEQGEAAIQGLEDIAVSHDNCPHQIILCGKEASIDLALSRLRDAKVLCEKLPFQSGFHSPFLRPYLGQIIDLAKNFNQGIPRVPLWSANSLAPFPLEREAGNRLFVDHLLQRVRFRELIERLYASGYRAFIQMGVGRLTGFVQDSLGGRPHLAATALVPGEDGLLQMRRLAAELWCEGYPVQLHKLGLRVARSEAATRPAKGIRLELATPHPVLRRAIKAAVSEASIPPPAAASSFSLPPELATNPIARELAAVSRDLAVLSQEVVTAWGLQPPRPVGTVPTAQTLGPRRLSRVVRYSVATMPEVVDHCLIRLPKDLSNLAERFPVVPMMRSIDTLIELAEELVPELIPIEIERVRANRWLEVEPAVDVELKAEFDGKDRIRVAVGDYLEGTVVLAKDYPPAPAPQPLGNISGIQPCHTAREYYEDGWTFHGPAFQMLTELGPMTDKGIEGKIDCLPARGALLDAGGQLAGYWCVLHTERDRIVLPYRIDRVRYYGPHPATGDRMEGRAHILELTDLWQRSHIEIYKDNRVWVRMEGFEDRRFQGDGSIFLMAQSPGTRGATLMRPEGYSLIAESWETSASRYLIARLYLSSQELAEYRSKPPRQQRSWLLGRIAAKDAVRNLLWAQGSTEIYPMQVQVGNDDKGRPYLAGPWRDDLRLSLAHKDNIAVAMVAKGVDIGIDVERIESRDQAFVRAAFHASELDLLPEEGGDEWLTRLWVAKEALAKYRGQGLNGDPHGLVITAVNGQRLLVDGVWVATRRDGDHVVGWTEHSAIWRPSAT